MYIYICYAGYAYNCIYRFGVVTPSHHQKKARHTTLGVIIILPAGGCSRGFMGAFDTVWAVRRGGGHGGQVANFRPQKRRMKVSKSIIIYPIYPTVLLIYSCISECTGQSLGKLLFSGDVDQSISGDFYAHCQGSHCRMYDHTTYTMS